jgi:type-F conjugative transfer system pilin assembly protein TrbC
VLILLPSPVLSDELKRSVQELMERAGKEAATMKIPESIHQEAGMKAAQESADLYHSPEYQEKLKCEQNRLKEEVFSEFVQEQAVEKEPAPGRLDENEKIYLFFSSSVPDRTMNNYLTAIEEVENPGITMVMNGFVPGKRKEYLARITKKDLACVSQLKQKTAVQCERFEIPIKIKPSLFDRFDIKQVPALVYERDGDAWKITGDMGLDYLLKRINREAKSYGVEGLINTLQGS